MPIGNGPLQIFCMSLKTGRQTKGFTVHPKKLCNADQTNVDGRQLTDVWNNQFHCWSLPPVPFFNIDSGVPVFSVTREATGLRFLENSFNVTSGPRGIAHRATGTAGL